MDTTSILRELQNQRDAIDAAIAALEGTRQSNGRRRSPDKPKAARLRRKLSAAARKRISQAAKARWAKAKKAGRHAL
jgi:hypothetical protein